MGGAAKAHEKNPNLYLAKLATDVVYVVKGTCPKTGAVLGLERIKAQGRVIGKRCGRSVSLVLARTDFF